MLTGGQIREACALLDWDRFDLQRWTALPFIVIDRAMRGSEGMIGTLVDEIIIKEAFHRAGVAFEPEGARLRENDC